MQEAIGAAKHGVVRGKERLLKVFSFVPDDKLTWSPSETSKSSLRVVAHVGISNKGMAGIIRGEKVPDISIAEFFGQITAAELTIKTREQAVQLIEESTNELLAALDTLTPEAIGSTITLPFGEFPMAGFMHIPGHHAGAHTGQLEYIQTIWGDLDPHM